MKKTDKINMKNAKYIIAILAITGLFVQSCNKPNEATDNKDEKFSITDTMMKHLELSPVSIQPIINEVKLSGKIMANEDHVAKVFPRVDGIIESLKVQLGDYVTKGQVLATIRSAQIADLDNQQQITSSNILIAKKNLSVATELLKSGLGTEKDVAMATQELQKAESEYKKAKETARLYDVGKGNSYYMHAPISGFIIEKNAVPNMDFRVENIDHFFTISDLSDIWVIADVYETDLNKVKLGYDVDVTTLADPDKKIKGKIDKIFNILDPESRVMKVRVRLSNPNYALKPNMFTSVVVKHEDPSVRMLSIPSKAVIFDKSKQWVMIFKDKSHIETRQITVFKAIGDNTYISSGLKEGEQVISKQQLLIYDALND